MTVLEERQREIVQLRDQLKETSTSLERCKRDLAIAESCVTGTDDLSNLDLSNSSLFANLDLFGSGGGAGGISGEGGSTGANVSPIPGRHGRGVGREGGTPGDKSMDMEALLACVGGAAGETPPPSSSSAARMHRSPGDITGGGGQNGEGGEGGDEENSEDVAEERSVNKSFQMKQRQHKTRMAGMGQAIDSQEVYVGKLVEEQKRFESMRRGYVRVRVRVRVRRGLSRYGEGTFIRGERGVERGKRGMRMNERR
jgi:hypothetical protein